MNAKPHAEPELHLLLPKDTLEQGLLKSLFRNLDDFFFPKKLPPLLLTSKPVPVKDIWGEYNYKKPAAVRSTVMHIIAIGAIVGGTIAGRHVVKEVTKPHETVTLIAPSEDIPPLQPSKTLSGGGGGGGDKDKFQAPKGRLPKQDMTPLTPPDSWTAAARMLALASFDRSRLAIALREFDGAVPPAGAGSDYLALRYALLAVIQREGPRLLLQTGQQIAMIENVTRAHDRTASLIQIDRCRDADRAQDHGATARLAQILEQQVAA